MTIVCSGFGMCRHRSRRGTACGARRRISLAVQMTSAHIRCALSGNCDQLREMSLAIAQIPFVKLDASDWTPITTGSH
jgi:hypothetical protein